MRRAAGILFAAYEALVLWLLFGQREPLAEDYWACVAANCNLIPLRSIAEFVQDLIRPESYGVFRFAVVQILGNVIMFLPLGFFLPLLFHGIRTYLRLLLLSVIIVTGIELVQLFTLLGSCDIDDLILNTVGVSLGYAGYCFLRRIHWGRL